MSFQGAHYSKDFFKLLDVWPKGGFLPFPSSETRGLAQSKATIIVENVSNKFVAFRVIQEQSCTLSLRCRPMVDILEPNTTRKIEILNDSDHPCTLSDRIYIEAVEYNAVKPNDLDNGVLKKTDNPQFNQDNLLKYLEDKQSEYFCIKCYETNTLSLIPMEEQLFRVERRLREIENLLKKFKLWSTIKDWSVPILMAFGLILVIVLSFIPNINRKLKTNS